MNTVIVENESRSASLLKRMLEEYCPGINVSHTFYSVAEAKENLAQSNADLAFFDVELGDGSAFDLLDSYPGKLPHIIFTTAYDHYAIKAFKFSAVDYLLKPINIKELQSAVERVRKIFDSNIQSQNLSMLIKSLVHTEVQNGKISLPTMEGFVFEDIKNIIRLEADGSYTKFFFSNRTQLMVSHNLKEYEELFSSQHFFRIHHSHIVNLKHISRFVKSNGGYVVMDDGSEVAVASRRKEDFLQVLGIC